MKAKYRLKNIEASGKHLYKQHEIDYPEALSKVSYQNAIDYFTNKGIKGSHSSEKIEFYAEAIQKSLKTLQ